LIKNHQTNPEKGTFLFVKHRKKKGKGKMEKILLLLLRDFFPVVHCVENADSEGENVGWLRKIFIDVTLEILDDCLFWEIQCAEFRVQIAFK